MALLLRAQKAKREKEQDGVGKETREGSDTDAILPFASVEHYLKDHPLVHNGSSAKDIHSAIARLHAFYTNTPKKTNASMSAACGVCVRCRMGTMEFDDAKGIPVCDQCGMWDTPEFETTSDVTLPSRTSPSCVHCGGYVVLDAKEGIRVCNECGVCAQIGINVTPEYVAPAVISKGKRKRCIDGVPDWMVQKHRSGDAATVSYMDDLEHWNGATSMQLSTDDLAWADALLRQWKATGGDTRDTRIVAVLIYAQIKDKLPTSESIRTQLSKGKIDPVFGIRRGSMERVDYGPPQPQFDCLHCGQKHTSRKEVRMCLRTSNGRFHPLA